MQPCWNKAKEAKNMSFWQLVSSEGTYNRYHPSWPERLSRGECNIRGIRGEIRWDRNITKDKDWHGHETINPNLRTIVYELIAWNICLFIFSRDFIPISLWDKSWIPNWSTCSRHIPKVSHSFISTLHALHVSISDNILVHAISDDLDTFSFSSQLTLFHSDMFPGCSFTFIRWFGLMDPLRTVAYNPPGSMQRLPPTDTKRFIAEFTSVAQQHADQPTCRLLIKFWVVVLILFVHLFHNVYLTQFRWFLYFFISLSGSSMINQWHFAPRNSHAFSCSSSRLYWTRHLLILLPPSLSHCHLPT